MQEQLREYGLDQQLKVEVEQADKLTNDGETKFKRIVSKLENGNGKKNDDKSSETSKTKDH